MAKTRSALFAVLIVLVAAGAGWWYWRGRPEGPATTSAARGGELIVALRGEPSAYNRYVEGTAYADLVSTLTDAKLVRVNRVSDELEPWLAESWTQSDDGRSYTLTLRRDVKFSDGIPFTSADVLFSFRALYDPRVNSRLASGIAVNGQPLTAAAPDAHTVIVTLPAPLTPGLRVLDNLPILPRHKLEPALDAGQFATAWIPKKPLTDLAGLGPFVLAEHIAGQRMVFTRNPHYWRRDQHGVQLPYLDKMTVVIIPDQNAEALRVESGEVDVAVNADIRPEDYVRFKRAAEQGRLRLADLGVGLDANFLWFNLARRGPTLKKPWLARREFRQAISHAVDREALANTVYLGMAVPVFGPITPGNRKWYADTEATSPYDVSRARALLSSIGLMDRNDDGTLDDAAGTPVQFSILTQRGHTIRERSATVLQEHLRRVGISTDVVSLDNVSVFQRWNKADYETIYSAIQASSTDPALNSDFWFSSGGFHMWHPHQPEPATEWEARIDELMRRQSVSPDAAERYRLFADVQRIVGEELPGIYFAAPRIVVAYSSRILNATPALQTPQVLWNPDSIAVVAGSRGRE